MRPRRRDDAAASSVASFIVALGVFSLTFAGVTYFLMDYIAKTAPIENVDSRGKAEAGLEVLLGSAGLPADWEGVDWTSDPSLEPDRLGLLENGSRTKVDYNKLRRLQGTLPGFASVTPTVFGEAVGIEDHEMLLRTYPIFTKEDTGYVDWPEGYPVAYVANVTSGLSTLSAVAKAETGSLGRIDVDYVNSTVFTTPITVSLGVATSALLTTGDRFPDTPSVVRTHLLPRLAGFAFAQDDATPTVPTCESMSGSLAALLPTCDNYVASNWSWNNTHWKVYKTSSLPAGAGFAASSAEHVLTPSRYARTSGSAWAWSYSYPGTDWLVTPTIDISSDFTSAALHLNHSVMGIDRPNTESMDDYAEVLVLCTTCAGGASTTWASLATWENNTATSPSDFRTNSTDLSTYVGETIRLAFRWNASAYLTGLPAVPVDLTGYNMPGPGKGWFIRDIHVDGVTGSTTTGLWRNDFSYDEDLSQYRLVIFGGNTVQTSYANDGLSSPEVGFVLRDAIADWVDAGGKLIALGSPSLANDWLQPALTGSSSVPSFTATPDEASSDVTHTLVTVPYVLDDTVLFDSRYRVSKRYVPSADPTGDPYYVTPLLTSANEPLLMASTSSTGLSGDAVLTSLVPGTFPRLAMDHFMQNAIGYLRYRSLYLDYGPPADTARTSVGSASRVVLVETGDDTMGDVEMRITLYAWR